MGSAWTTAKLGGTKCPVLKFPDFFDVVGVIHVFFAQKTYENMIYKWILKCFFFRKQSLQCEAPKIAKLVYNSNNYGLWYL